MGEALVFDSCYSLEEIDRNFEGFNFYRELTKSLGETKMRNNLYCHCNLCGKEFDIWDYEENFQIHTLLGYGTAYDGDELHLRLCCNCMNKIIENCYFSPIREIDYELAHEGKGSLLLYYILLFADTVKEATLKLAKRVKDLLSKIHIKK